MIPKVIHYCWFGGNPLPDLAKKCIASWEKYCPDYKIVRWDECNFDVTCCDYVREAYEAKKWAFVSDYARLWIVHQEGGIYLDTDVELLKSLDECLSVRFFFATEKSKPFFGKTSICVATGLGFGAEPRCPVVEKMVDEYAGAHFRLDNGEFDLRACPERNTDALCAFGYRREDRMQFLEGGVVYPSEYFCPKDFRSRRMQIRENTLAIHHFSASWKGDESQYAFALAERYKVPGMSYIARLIGEAKYHGFKGLARFIAQKIRETRRPK